MEKRIVLTGGPGSGKTTVINNIIKNTQKLINLSKTEIDSNAR